MVASVVWPTNVTDVFVEELGDMVGIEAIIDRPLAEDDASGSLGCFVIRWAPTVDKPYVLGQKAPEVAIYTYGLDLIVKGHDRAEIQAEGGVLTKRLRTMLYHDANLQVRLEALSETTAFGTEKFTRMFVTKQDYRTGTLGGVHIAASTTTVTVETENNTL